MSIIFDFLLSLQCFKIPISVSLSFIDLFFHHNLCIFLKVSGGKSNLSIEIYIKLTFILYLWFKNKLFLEYTFQLFRRIFIYLILKHFFIHFYFMDGKNLIKSSKLWKPRHLFLEFWFIFCLCSMQSF